MNKYTYTIKHQTGIVDEIKQSKLRKRFRK